MRKVFKAPRAIYAQVLIPGKGDPIQDGVVVYEDEKIIFSGPRRLIPPEYARVESTTVPVLMPGLWDCHTHIFGTTRIATDDFLTTAPALAGARGARDAAALLNAGYTSIRELSGYGVYVAQAVDEGTLEGPSIYAAGSMISPTGGPSDCHDYSLSSVEHMLDNERGLPISMCDGEAECLKAVRKELRKGARVIKMCTSGDVASKIGDVTHQQFSDEEINIIVQEAARAKRAVAAHCHGEEGIAAALRGEVTTIEHGSYLNDECVSLMLARQTILVPTRTIIEVSLKSPQLFSPDSYQKLLDVSRNHTESYKKAIKAGVKIALGSDIGVSVVGSNLAHGNNALELLYAVKAGMTPLQAIEASTATAPLTLGPQAPKAGALLPGYDADFIAVSRNPLEDISILTDTANVTHVWKHGRLVKSPGKPVGFTF